VALEFLPSFLRKSIGTFDLLVTFTFEFGELAVIDRVLRPQALKTVLRRTYLLL